MPHTGGGGRSRKAIDAADFRKALVRPLAGVGSAVVSTDHVTVENAQGKGITRVPMAA